MGKELDDINEEIMKTDKNIVAMEQLENELDDAINDDLKRNSNENERISNEVLRVDSDTGMSELGIDGIDDSEYVVVNKKELMKLKEQLNELANQVREKRERAKKRNEELKKFVDDMKVIQR